MVNVNVSGIQKTGTRLAYSSDFYRCLPYLRVGGNAEIGDFHFTSFVNENVPAFQVAVNDLLAKEIHKNAKISLNRSLTRACIRAQMPPPS